MDNDAIEKYTDIVESIRAEYQPEEQNYPWIVGFSDGKNSTLV